MTLSLPVAVPLLPASSTWHAGATKNHADVEGEIRLRKLGAKRVEDAGQLIDRAKAHAHGKDAGGVAGFAGGIDVPGDGTAAADAAVEDAVDARRAFELQGDVAVMRGGDHVAARDAGRLAVRLFIAAEHDGDFGLLEDARGLHGFEREEHVDQAALHVVDAGTGADIALDAVGLEWAGLLKHRVHVADEQHALAAFARLGAGCSATSTPARLTCPLESIGP